MAKKPPLPILTGKNTSQTSKLVRTGSTTTRGRRKPPINTGFYMIKSNNKTIALFDKLYCRKDRSKGLKEHDVMVNLMYEGMLRKLGLKVRFLDTMLFSGFCQDSRDVKVVATVHANCCRHMAAKLTDLTEVIHDWKRFRGFKGNESLSFRWSNHVACADSWRN